MVYWICQKGQIKQNENQKTSLSFTPSVYIFDTLPCFDAFIKIIDKR